MAQSNGEFSFSTGTSRVPLPETSNGATKTQSEPIFFAPTAVPKASQTASSTQRDTKPKNEASLPTTSPKHTRVQLAPGYSQIGWMMRCQRDKKLGIGNLKFNPALTRKEVRRHKTVEDAWIIVNERVYNLTPYLNYHPGGIDILLPVLGKDATLLFNQYHRWVNVEALLEACWVGKVAS